MLGTRGELSHYCYSGTSSPMILATNSFPLCTGVSYTAIAALSPTLLAPSRPPRSVNTALLRSSTIGHRVPSDKNGSYSSELPRGYLRRRSSETLAHPTSPWARSGAQLYGRLACSGDILRALKSTCGRRLGLVLVGHGASSWSSGLIPGMRR